MTMNKLRHTRKGFAYALLSATALLLLWGCGTTGSTTTISTTCRSVKGEVSDIRQQAEVGDAEAQFRLGDWYVSSCGDQNTREGAKWYRRSAEQGYRDAQFKIAAMYLYGFGVAKDTKEADKWLRKAAEQGHIAAIRSLGSMYLEGKRVTKDLDEAEKWFSLAAAQGDWQSNVQLEKLLKEKDPAWAREQQQIAEELKKQVEEREENRRAEEQQRQLAQIKQLVQQAKDHFVLISVFVTEAEETKRLRAQGASTADGIAGGVVGIASSTGQGAGIGALGFGFGWAGPIGAGIGAALGIVMGITDAIEKRIPKEEKAEIEAAAAILNQALAEENVEQRTQAQLLALAELQQAGDLFVTGSESITNTTAHRLEIKIQNIGVVKVPDDRRAGRLWLAAQVKIIGNGVENSATEKRFCYGDSETPALLEWAEDDAKSFREDLVVAYRNLSNQILTDMIGLAPDPNAEALWEHTEKACAVQPNEEEDVYDK